MKQLGRKTVLALIIAVGLAWADTAKAAHATNFLDALQQEVTNRLADTEAELTRAQRRSLSSAARILNRDTRTLGADALLLASASATLRPHFRDPEDVLSALPLATFEAFKAEADAQLEDITTAIGTNRVSRAVRNCVLVGSNALERAERTNLTVSARASAVSVALKKFAFVQPRLTNLVSEPNAVAPPATIQHDKIELVENAPIHDQTKFWMPRAGENSGYYNADIPEELGTWTYSVRGDIGVVTVRPDYPAGNHGTREFHLTFTSATGGRFTGTNIEGSPMSGTFMLVDE
jgi:hypothetical protein